MNITQAELLQACWRYLLYLFVQGFVGHQSSHSHYQKSLIVTFFENLQILLTTKIKRYPEGSVLILKEAEQNSVKSRLRSKHSQGYITLSWNRYGFVPETFYVCQIVKSQWHSVPLLDRRSYTSSVNSVSNGSTGQILAPIMETIKSSGVLIIAFLFPAS